MRSLTYALLAVSCLAVSAAACQSRSGVEPDTADATDPAGPPPSPPSPAPVAPAEGAEQAATRIEGCLAAAESTEAAASEFPARGQTRSVGKKHVTVTPKEGGVTVNHELDHACCLKGRVDTSIGAGKVEIVEQLSGQPCRCTCNSTLNTEVALSAGEWEVVVVVQRPDGKRDEVHREKVTTGGQR